MPNYEVCRDLLGHPAGGHFARGDVVAADALGRDPAGVGRLAEIGAVEETSKAATAAAPGVPTAVPADPPPADDKKADDKKADDKPPPKK